MVSRRSLRLVPEEFWGCTRHCGQALAHTEGPGCEKYVPPCEHPLESIGYDSEGEGRVIECQDCRIPLSVKELADHARTALWAGGCYCPETCSGKCSPARSTAWTLDPAKVLRILELESHL